MSTYDLNLLKALDALLCEGSVHGAAQRMHLSDAAMSRTLSRIRDTFGDPILVRAGRALVPTPRALALQAHVRAVLDAADAILHTSPALDLPALTRTFTVRANEGFVAEYGGPLLNRLTADAPQIQVCFSVKAEKDAKALREGRIDLDIGVLGESGPEIRLQTLLRDRFVGVVTPQHPLASDAIIAVERFVAYPHISVSRRGLALGPIDDLLRAHGLTRHVAAVATSFPSALALLRGTTLIANVPERQTVTARLGLHTFLLPFPTEPVTVSMMWHPRADHDPAHRWLRHCLREVCGAEPNSLAATAE